MDHMVDQLTAHAQVGVTLAAPGCQPCVAQPGAGRNPAAEAAVFAAAGAALGRELRVLAEAPADALPRANATFCAPLDEAYSVAEVELGAGAGAGLEQFDVAIPRKFIGPSYATSATEAFFAALAVAAGMRLRLRSERGTNAHHVVEATFKSFARALRAALDKVEGYDLARAAVAAVPADARRTASKSRGTKETSVSLTLDLDGAGHGASNTGLATLDAMLDALRVTAGFDLTVEANGDLWIDDHHTTEDVAITLGQCLATAAGSKAGLTRMGSATAKEGDAEVRVVVDLSNRAFLGYDLEFAGEMVGDVSAEMVEHVFMSLAHNAAITVHVSQLSRGEGGMDLALAAVRALGACLRQCSARDPRRAGAVASSKGTLCK